MVQTIMGTVGRGIDDTNALWAQDGAPIQLLDCSADRRDGGLVEHSHLAEIRLRCNAEAIAD
jgi:hypothetical protein